jgi:hypothetical protein
MADAHYQHENIRKYGICSRLRDVIGILAPFRKTSGYILSCGDGQMINLNNIASRVVIPVLKKAGIAWHGWYALRRGIATLATFPAGSQGAVAS